MVEVIDITLRWGDTERYAPLMIEPLEPGRGPPKSNRFEVREEQEWRAVAVMGEMKLPLLALLSAASASSCSCAGDPSAPNPPPGPALGVVLTVTCSTGRWEGEAAAASRAGLGAGPCSPSSCVKSTMRWGLRFGRANAVVRDTGEGRGSVSCAGGAVSTSVIAGGRE